MNIAKILEKEHNINAIIIPSNRFDFEKTKTLTEASSYPVFIHNRGKLLPEIIPKADIAISWMYSQIFHQDDLAKYPSGILNMHGGKLPEYRGASVLQWAIVNGETELGVTWHSLIEEVDAGPIWAESLIPIPADFSGFDMREAMIREGIRLFPACWRRYTKEVAPLRFIDPAEGRVWPQRTASHGVIGKGMSARQIFNLVRAHCAPWPPAMIETDQGMRAIGAVLENLTPGSIRYRTSDGWQLYLVPQLQ